MPWTTLIKKLIRMCLGITDPTTTPLKTSNGQILNFGGHDGSECHRVPLPIRLNRKRFREQIGKCCTAFATTRHSKCDAVISFIWINSSRRSESQAAMTQCNQKMKVKAVMTIFGRSLTSGDLCTFFQYFLESFSQLTGTRCRLRFAAPFLFGHAVFHRGWFGYVHLQFFLFFFPVQRLRGLSPGRYTSFYLPEIELTCIKSHKRELLWTFT